MASDQRFQRTVQAVAEAVQTFASGTFDFAESIKQIWGPQPEPHAVETSDPLPVEGIQDVQIVDQFRERTPVSQNGDQPAINPHSNPPSVSMHDGDLEVREEIAPPETADMQLSSEMDTLAGSTQQFTGSCYECFARWRDPTRFPPCQSIRGQEACAYCIHMQIPCVMIPAGQIQKMMNRKRRADFFRIVQNNSARIEQERFSGASCETSDLLEIPLSSPIADVPQKQVGSKRTYQDIDEQRPESKRQRTQELWEILIPKRDRWLKKAMQEEQDDHGAVEDRVSSSLSVYSSSSSEEEKEVAPIKVQQNRQESSPVKTPDMPRVGRDMINEELIHLEEGNHRSSSLTQEQSSAESSSSDDDDYSSEEEEQTVQHPAEVSQVKRNVKANVAIQLRDNSSEPSSSSSEDESSEESDDETEEEPNNQPTRKAVSQNERKETIKEAMPIPLGEDDNETESYSASSDDETSEEESDEPEESKKQPATKVEPQMRCEEKSKEPIEITNDEYSSSSEDGSSGEDTEMEP